MIATMIHSIFSQKIYPALLATYHWYLRTPERSLDKAYKAALQIKAIEDEHFNGNPVGSDSRYSSSMMDYFESDLKKQLKNVRMRLTEFKASRLLLYEYNLRAARRFDTEQSSAALILDKLRFIDEVVAKYTNIYEEVSGKDLIAPQDTTATVTVVRTPQPPKPQNFSKRTLYEQSTRSKVNTTGVLPRSILGTLTRLQIELDPNAEQDVVQNFRKTQTRTVTSIRFILLLIIVPILTHQLSKAVVVGPMVDHFRTEEVALFLNTEMEEEALSKLQRFEERIKFENLIAKESELSTEQMEVKFKEKALDIAEEYRNDSANAIKNVFADILSAGAFTYLLLVSKREISVLKEFFDNVVYGLSDSAKAFIIILFTDIFVGFHSPHGWEVILEGVSRHWGLPGNHDFIFLFIATFPVILDTIFKYWIFRYLNRISPSAVATYHNMNE